MKVFAWGLVPAVPGWGEVEHRRRPGAAPAGTGTPEAVVMLGFRDRGGRADAVNRWRVRAGVRSFDGPGVLVLSDGAVGGPVAEAELMAASARQRRGYRGPLVTAVESRGTWQNVADVIPSLEPFGRIELVSHPLHAGKARAYRWARRPDLAARLVRGRGHRPGEWPLAGPALTLLGRRNPWKETRAHP